MRRQRGAFLVWFVGLVVLAVLLLAGYTWLVVAWSYSTGERAGWVQKLSHKGWFCKSWEGELSMVSMPGTTPEKFLFSVWDDKVAEEINRNMGKRVSLHYEEKVGIPTNCFGETRYFVTRINVVDQIQLGPGAMVPATPGAAPSPGSGTPATESSTPPAVREGSAK
ncbi:MAG: hypothetical protein ACKVQU_35290 [Burkholderiales bacterium]